MTGIQGVSAPKIDAYVTEVARIEPINSVRTKLSGEQGEEKQQIKRPMFDLQQMSEQEKEKLQEELDNHNAKFSYTGKFLKFKYDEEAGMTYVEVVDTASQEVIVSLPPEFLIDLSVKMKKILGLYIDEKL